VAQAEAWRPVVGYEGLYSVSDHGRVKSLARTVLRGDVPHRVRTRILRAATQRRTGYLQVVLSNAGIQRRFYVHKLKAEAFRGDGT
jgi:hypothetical protein